MVKVKICGITSLKDAWAALDAGADALGFVFYPPSPRKVSPGEARAIIRTLPPLVTPVGVFVDEDIREVKRLAGSCGLKLVQLHGNETPRMVRDLGFPSMKVIKVRGAADVREARRFPSLLIMFDSWDSAVPGGTGRKFAWSALRKAPLKVPFVLSGGLNPQNVAQAVRLVRPFGVDASTGVEASPGVKDERKMRLFIRVAKTA